MNYSERFPDRDDWGGEEGEYSEDKPFETPPKFETREISPKEMVDIFSNGKFISTLDQAAEKTDETGCETGFTVLIDQTTGKTIIPDLRLGGTDTMLPSEIVAVIDGSDCGPAGIFLHFHFHPSSSDNINPSDQDLSNFFREKTLPFIGIGQVSKDKKLIDILLISTTLQTVPEDIDATMEATESDYMPRVEVQKALERYNFPNRIISFKKTETGYQLTPSSRKIIKGLSSTKVEFVPPEYGFEET